MRVSRVVNKHIREVAGSSPSCRTTEIVTKASKPCIDTAAPLDVKE